MEIFSYIITVATSQTGVEVFLAIKNIAGTGYAQYTRSDGFGNIEMWIIPKSKKSKEELVTQLQAVPFIQQVSVVKLSKPVTNDELLEVRKLFKGLGWDTSVVKDEDLSLFLNAKLQGQFTYMLHFDHDNGGKNEKVRIIRAEEHPLFSPEWLINNQVEEEILDRELTIDDLETGEVVISSVRVEEAPPPPPAAKGDET